MRRDWLLESGAELAPDELIITDVAPASTGVVPAALAERQVDPAVRSSRASSPTRSSPPTSPHARPAQTPASPAGRLGADGPALQGVRDGRRRRAARRWSCPRVPEFDRLSPKGLEIMPHQSRFLEAVRDGHRTFLLADEPGLGKTAESVLAASVADAYPLLAVVPNVVKMNWAREVERWTPQRRATVIHGDGEHVDAFADVFIVNYEILDRHLSWLELARPQGHGRRRGALHQEPAARSARRTCSRSPPASASRSRDPLLLALTGTPLINDVEDFDAIWQFLGWIDGREARPAA